MRVFRLSVLLVFGLALAGAAWAQGAPVTAADITRLETQADEIAKATVSLKKTDATLAASIDTRLSDLREEITYLKVKLRKDGNVPRADFTDLRDRLETLRVRAGLTASDKVSAAPVTGTPTEKIWTVPVGTMMDLRLQTPLNSGKVKVEQRFEATTLTDVVMGRDVVIPSGTVVRGFVSSVSAAGKISRKGSLTLSFDEIVIGPTPTRLRASVTQALDGKMGGEVGKIGAGAVVGGIVGGLLGGGKGAMLGVIAGGGGMMAATDGADVDLPVGALLTIRVDSPVDVSIIK
jgi:hypothetical protein